MTQPRFLFRLLNALHEDWAAQCPHERDLPRHVEPVVLRLSVGPRASSSGSMADSSGTSPLLAVLINQADCQRREPEQQATLVRLFRTQLFAATAAAALRSARESVRVVCTVMDASRWDSWLASDDNEPAAGGSMLASSKAAAAAAAASAVARVPWIVRSAPDGLGAMRELLAVVDRQSYARALSAAMHELVDAAEPAVLTLGPNDVFLSVTLELVRDDDDNGIGASQIDAREVYVWALTQLATECWAVRARGGPMDGAQSPAAVALFWRERLYTRPLASAHRALRTLRAGFTARLTVQGLAREPEPPGGLIRVEADMGFVGYGGVAPLDADRLHRESVRSIAVAIGRRLHAAPVVATAAAATAAVASDSAAESAPAVARTSLPAPIEPNSLWAALVTTTELGLAAPQCPRGVLVLPSPFIVPPSNAAPASSTAALSAELARLGRVFSGNSSRRLVGAVRV